MVAQLKMAVIEDHKDLRATLVEILESDGHQVAGFESGPSFWAGSDPAALDIVILDLNLPDKDGISIAQKLRAGFANIGIIMLTARVEPEDRRRGYQSGADIYLAKPSSALELTASVHALARRLGPPQSALRLDLTRMALIGRAGTIPLAFYEVAMLKEFILATDNTLDNSTIANIAGTGSEVSKAAIEVRIVRLRKKITAAGAEGNAIKAVRHFGYRLATKIDLS